MTKTYQDLFNSNQEWANLMNEEDSEFFSTLAKGQHPQFLWIGCSDSRVPAEKITGTNPGDLFVHRNIANMCINTDMSFLSVLDYAVKVLKVGHIIVCGHYSCGGVNTAMGNKSFGLIDNWLRHIKDVYRLHRAELDAIEDETERSKRLVELNVHEQVMSLCKTSTVQSAWEEGVSLEIHGLVYDIANGALKDLNVLTNSTESLDAVYKYETKPTQG